MSRIGRQPIAVPDKVKLTLGTGEMKAEGPKGKAQAKIADGITLKLEGKTLLVERKDDSPRNRALHGLTRTIVNNVVHGVSVGFERVLEITGVGYRAEIKGNEIHLTLGYSHPVVFPLPAGVTAEVEKQTKLFLRGADKVTLGETASRVRKLRGPEPYKGKGIKYAEETIRRKQGKTGAA